MKTIIMLLAMSMFMGTMSATEKPTKENKECVQLRYRTKYTQVLRASMDLEQWSYLAFPSVLQVNPSTILISYKRGEAHWGDTGAKLELMRYDVRTENVVETKIIGDIEELIFQMGEWVKFPNGDIANYVDMQKMVPNSDYRKNQRTGIYYTRSRDGGNSFSPMQKMGPVDEVEYGYVLEDVIVGSKAYLLVMTFPELVGKIGEKGWKHGKVHVIMSDDNGETWSHIRNLSEEFGDIDINESSFIRFEDGFLVTTRGYDGQQRLHLMNKEFKVIKQVNLTKEYSCVTGYIGRPRLFKQDGAVYLLGRNQTETISLALYKVDPETLQLQTHVVLDQRPGDGYYAESFFIEKNGKTFFNIITYAEVISNKPDIVRFEFLWEEINGISE